MSASTKDPMQTQFRQISGKRPSSPGVISSLLTVIGGVVLLALGLMFSLVVLAVIPVLLLLGYGYLRWKTRALREHLQKSMTQHQAPHQEYSQETHDNHQGDIIEGEVIHTEHEIHP